MNTFSRTPLIELLEQKRLLAADTSTDCPEDGVLEVVVATEQIQAPAFTADNVAVQSASTTDETENGDESESDTDESDTSDDVEDGDDTDDETSDEEDGDEEDMDDETEEDDMDESDEDTSEEDDDMDESEDDTNEEEDMDDSDDDSDDDDEMEDEEDMDDSDDDSDDDDMDDEDEDEDGDDDDDDDETVTTANLTPITTGTASGTAATSSLLAQSSETTFEQPLLAANESSPSAQIVQVSQGAPATPAQAVDASTVDLLLAAAAAEQDEPESTEFVGRSDQRDASPEAFDLAHEMEEKAYSPAPAANRS